MRKVLLLGVIWATVLFFSPMAFAATAAFDRKLYNQLLKFPNDRRIVEVDGVPCIKIFLKKGQSISYFCRFVEYFDDNFQFYRQRIALINRLEPMALVDGEDSLSTDIKFIYVPLNFSIPPKILPERIATASRLPRYILIDLSKQCLGLYEYGKLKHLFPISSGKDGTPPTKFTILSKERDHYSTLYENAWMPYSLRLFGNYFLHGGILPSYAASHGCVRLIYENAVFVYNWAEVGTPGEIIDETGMQQEQEEKVVPIREDPSIKAMY